MPTFLNLPLSNTLMTAPIAPEIPGSGGVQVSHLGVGGYMELPTKTYLYDLPINDNIDGDGYSSSQRKFGMIVYVMDEAKWFQLIPKAITSTLGVLSAVSHDDWLTLTETQKRFLLKPDAPAVVTETWIPEYVDGNGNPVYTDIEDESGNIVPVWGAIITTTINGTGNPADCWTELCLSCGNLEIVDVYASKTFTTEDANKIFHFHTGSSSNLTATVHTSCAAGFNLAVNNVGTGFLTLSGALGVSTVLDARHSGAFMYKSASAVYAVGRL